MASVTRSLHIDPASLLEREQRVAILLNSKLLAHCNIMRGISRYLEEHHLRWEVVLSSELHYGAGEDLTLWFDGIIADYNHERTRQILSDVTIPVVGLISGTNNIELSPHQTLISLDNESIISMACEFLIAKGLDNIAMYELQEDEPGTWQQSRRHAYRKFQQDRGQKINLFQGKHATFSTWMEELTNLGHWLSGLSKPCGVIVSSDARARFLLNACQAQKITVPDELSIVSVGDITPHELFFNTVLSVVSPNHEGIGELAAKQLALAMSGHQVPNVVKAPTGDIVEGNSTDFRKTVEPAVIQALHFIRDNFSRNIKVVDVLNEVGLSRTNLETKFKQEIGHSIRAEIHQQRINQVCKLLKDEALSIEKIADLVGYTSHHQLHAIFKKEMGQTPATYRANKRVVSF
jgi:LacI family transcriptional regulator